MKSKYSFWVFLSFLTAFILWWYYYAFTTLNTRVEEVQDSAPSALGEKKEVETEIKNPEPKEVEEALTDVVTYTINASSLEHWVYFDFSKGSVIETGDPSSLDWDIGFKRALVISNSGQTNPQGGGGIAKLENTDLESVKEAPESGYTVDIRVNPTETENPVIKKWYEYSYMTHILKPKKGDVYVIRTADGKFAKMQILKYYCGRLTGCYTIKYVYQGSGNRKFD